jgi:uncharacterized protein (TIGR03086 family)
VDTCFAGIVDRFSRASAGFEQVLRRVGPQQWRSPTPCSEWSVRDLVNHMTRGNLNYVLLLDGGTAAEFLRLRNVDALGADPVGAYTRSVAECADAFAAPGALSTVLDYPLGSAPGQQLLAVRTTDTVVHTWDLARGVGADDALDAGLVSWVNEHLDTIYAGLAETPVAADTTHRFFAPARAAPREDVSEQDRLLRRMGRTP